MGQSRAAANCRIQAGVRYRNGHQGTARCGHSRHADFRENQGYLPGFADDNELRRYLIRAGGGSFKRKADDVELWGLLSKHQGDAFK